MRGVASYFQVSERDFKWICYFFSFLSLPLLLFPSLPFPSFYEQLCPKATSEAKQGHWFF